MQTFKACLFQVIRATTITWRKSQDGTICWGLLIQMLHQSITINRTRPLFICNSVSNTRRGGKKKKKQLNLSLLGKQKLQILILHQKTKMGKGTNRGCMEYILHSNWHSCHQTVENSFAQSCLTLCLLDVLGHPFKAFAITHLAHDTAHEYLKRTNI